MRKLTGFLVLVVAVLTCSALSAAEWLHVRVDSKNSEKVRVSVPIDLVSAVLPLVGEKVGEGRMTHNGLKWDEHDLTVADMRRIWQAVRSGGSDQQLADIVSEGHNVNVAVQGEYLRIDADGEEQERVSVKVPVSVVDALLSGEGEELNLMAAVEALRGLGSSELVVVQSDDEQVRVWIDNQSKQ